ncbi:DUF4167 domain-containing protein [Amaricoccus sp.]|uniref:DUF4167 domain-containing protein n=1 Tax=Amaricoccus sp. TaxID=1872485 RepID=UPI001B51CA97|nr:DUF4167 domain-containing protein [Amaricoccus sp.]MBP7242000.1 DUF4167 domain-containing protein [Amaricoccus sp.]
MRPSNKQRSRNKPGNLGGNNPNMSNRRPLGNIINRVFESAGPDGKVRGTPQQIIDKYQLLARDAQLAGDRVAEQSFLQHVEHYSRLLGEAQAEQQAQQQAQRQAFERDEERREERRDGGDQRFEASRFDGPRPEGQQRRDEPRRDDRREDGGFGGDRPRHDRNEQRQPQPAISSGLVTIDADDPYDSGLIETPESRGAPEPVELRPMSAPAPEVAEAQSVSVAEAAAPAEPEPEPADPAPAEPTASAAPAEAEAAAEPPAAPKRGRPRRRAPRPEGETAAS